MRAPTSREAALGEVLLAVEDVSLSFGGVSALTGVSFDIRKGEIRAIIGPNGAGKTSMLNVVNGFYQPQSGRIIFKGRVRTSMRPYAAERKRDILHGKQHLAERRLPRRRRPHAARSVFAAGTGYGFKSRIATRAAMTPLCPSSKVTSVAICASVEPL